MPSPTPAPVACPKCHHVRQPNEAGDAAICPACGLVFAKWAARAEFVAPATQRRAREDEGTAWTAALLATPEAPSSLVWWGRVGTLALLLIWGIALLRVDFTNVEVYESFMHLILLPIHEAGHVLFRLLGEFMGVAGGSLMQLLLPFGIGVAFVVKQRNPFGAAVCLWWVGVSLLDLAPYIYDARDPKLMLLSGTTGAEGFHDWIYLLDTIHQTAHSPAWGRWAWRLGAVTTLVGLLWGALILRCQRPAEENAL